MIKMILKYFLDMWESVDWQSHYQHNDEINFHTYFDLRERGQGQFQVAYEKEDTEEWDNVQADQAQGLETRWGFICKKQFQIQTAFNIKNGMDN